MLKILKQLNAVLHDLFRDRLIVINAEKRRYETPEEYNLRLRLLAEMGTELFNAEAAATETGVTVKAINKHGFADLLDRFFAYGMVILDKFFPSFIFTNAPAQPEPNDIVF